MIESSTFKPSKLLSNPHIQTLWPRVFNGHSKYNFYTERLELKDGDFVDLSWTDKQQKAEHSAIVIVFHGLEGSIQSPYATGIMNTIKQQSWMGVLMHFRGCSGQPNRLDRSYHSGETGDIRFCLKSLKQRFPDSPIFAIGYSLGGNALLKYLGEEKQNSPLTAAIAVSVPFQLNLGADRLDQGFSKFYQWYLIKSLRKKMRDKFRSRPPAIDLNKLDEYQNFWLFDHHVTAPLHGFSSAEEYYQISSSKQYLHYIKTPTLILHAKDDPFVPIAAIPRKNELSEQIRLELSEQGGHVGFISGSNPFKPKFWLEERIPEFIHEHLTQTP